jgi:FlaA1/EpsC-like NDP-sugar epimerase
MATQESKSSISFKQQNKAQRPQAISSKSLSSNTMAHNAGSRMRFKGKVVFITGAGTGIGKATAMALKEQGEFYEI